MYILIFLYIIFIIMKLSECYLQISVEKKIMENKLINDVYYNFRAHILLWKSKLETYFSFMVNQTGNLIKVT